MKNTKRILSAALAALMLLSITACGSKPSESSLDESEASVSSESSSSEFYNPVEEPTSSSEAESAEPSKELIDKLNAQIKLNPETVGYLNIPDTGIEDFVVQAADNNKYYRLDNLGKYSYTGCYYADFRDIVKDRASLKKNTVIYGHNLDDKLDGERFARLINYTDTEYAKAHPYIYLTTTEDEMVFKVFATFYTNWKKFDYIETDFTTAAIKFPDLLNEAKASSEQNFDVQVDSNDKIITLSTCTYKFGSYATNKSQRFVVMGRLLRAGEADTDPVTVTKNPSPKVPTF